MDPMGDHEIWQAPLCAIRPGVTCEQRIRMDERKAAIAWARGLLREKLTREHPVGEPRRNLIKDQEFLKDATWYIPIIEETLEDYRKTFKPGALSATNAHIPLS